MSTAAARAQMIRSIAYVKDTDLSDVAGWIRAMGRVGCVAKGVVYAVVGLLAVQVAAGNGGDTEGAKGAIRAIGSQPFGRTMLGVLAAGLIGYALWRFVQAAKDTEMKGSDAKGIIVRIGFAISGAIYLSLALFTGRGALRIGSGSGGDSDSQREYSAWLLSESWGIWVLGAIGAIVIGVGLAQLYMAYRASFMKYYDRSRMDTTLLERAKRLGQAGLTARSVTFAIIGWFLIRAAWTANAGETKDLEEALALIAEQPHGKVLLGIVAIGMIAYAAHCILQGVYRRFRKPAF